VGSVPPMQPLFCATTVNARAFAFLGPPAQGGLLDALFAVREPAPQAIECHSCRARLQAIRRRSAVCCAKEQRCASELRDCVASHRAWAKKASALTCTTLRRRHPTCCEGKR
jgi:hypothetical protein